MRSACVGASEIGQTGVEGACVLMGGRKMTFLAGVRGREERTKSPPKGTKMQVSRSRLTCIFHFADIENILLQSWNLNLIADFFRAFLQNSRFFAIAQPISALPMCAIEPKFHCDIRFLCLLSHGGKRHIPTAKCLYHAARTFLHRPLKTDN